MIYYIRSVQMEWEPPNNQRRRIPPINKERRWWIERKLVAAASKGCLWRCINVRIKNILIEVMFCSNGWEVGTTLCILHTEYSYSLSDPKHPLVNKSEPDWPLTDMTHYSRVTPATTNCSWTAHRERFSVATLRSQMFLTYLWTIWLPIMSEGAERCTVPYFP